MSLVRNKNTRDELIIGSLLHRLGRAKSNRGRKPQYGLGSPADTAASANSDAGTMSGLKYFTVVDANIDWRRYRGRNGDASLR